MSTFFETDSVISLRNMARKTGDLSKLSIIFSQARESKAYTNPKTRFKPYPKENKGFSSGIINRNVYPGVFPFSRITDLTAKKRRGKNKLVVLPSSCSCKLNKILNYFIFEQVH
jgi:hypothetical protein